MIIDNWYNCFHDGGRFENKGMLLALAQDKCAYLSYYVISSNVAIHFLRVKLIF